MSVLVTGATGFIGSRLALRLKELGTDVLATGQSNSPIEKRRLAELNKAGVSVSAIPLQDTAAMRELIPATGSVIHLAAAQHECNVPDTYFHEVNVQGTRALLELSRAAGVKRFIYGSTIGVYGGIDGKPNGCAPFSETSPPSPGNAYGRSKLEAEKVVAGFASSMEVCVVRIAETYGPGDMRMLKLFRAVDSGLFVMVGSGQNCHHLIHVSDLVEGLLTAAAHPSANGETFVLAGKEPVTTRELVNNVAAALGKPPPRLRLPLLPFVGAAAVMEAGLRPLGIQPPLHRRRLDFFRKSFVFSTAKAQRVLDFKPRLDLRSGAADAVRWYRAHGFLEEGRA